MSLCELPSPLVFFSTVSSSLSRFLGRGAMLEVVAAAATAWRDWSSCRRRLLLLLLERPSVCLDFLRSLEEWRSWWASSPVVFSVSTGSVVVLAGLLFGASVSAPLLLRTCFWTPTVPSSFQLDRDNCCIIISVYTFFNCSKDGQEHTFWWGL